MTKTDLKAFNDLPRLPPNREKVETVKVLRQLVKSSIALAELKGLAFTLPNSAILLNAVVLKEARVSSEIENVITTQDKLYQALSAKGSEADPSTKEVLRYREAVLYGARFISQKGFLSTNAIVAIQKILEENNAGIRKLPGTALRNATTNKIIYTPPDDHEMILRLMRNLENYLNEKNDISPLIRMAIQHYQFESIHPFYDGNGRTGRIINILHIVLHGLLESPILYLSNYIIKNKSDYYRLLQEVRTKNKWEEWILYMLKGVEETSYEAIAQIKTIQALFVEIQETIKAKAPKVYSKELIEILFEHPYCKSEILTTRMKVSRITAAKYLKQLQGIGVLKSKKVWKETLYVNTKLFDLLKK